MTVGDRLIRHQPKGIPVIDLHFPLVASHCCDHHRSAADLDDSLRPNNHLAPVQLEHSRAVSAENPPAVFGGGSIPSIKDIQAALGISEARVYQLKKIGMPLHSIPAAVDWRMKRASTNGKLCRPNVGLAAFPVDSMSGSASERHVSSHSQDNQHAVPHQPSGQNPTIHPVSKPKLVILNDGTVYEGECDSLGKFHGRGKLTFVCGDTYVGLFSKGSKHGHGTYLYTNQSFYSGHWRNGLKHGKGVSVYKTSGACSDYSWSAGDIFDGEFVDNIRHGACEYTWFNGEKLRCVWDNGNCPEWFNKNAEILASVCRTEPSTVPELPIVDAEPLDSSSDSSLSPPPSIRPPVVYSRSPPPSKPPVAPQESRPSQMKSRGLDQNGWFATL